MFLLLISKSLKLAQLLLIAMLNSYDIDDFDKNVAN
jgi:hypothetical protein